MRRRILAGVLSLMMLLQVLPVSAAQDNAADLQATEVQEESLAEDVSQEDILVEETLPEDTLEDGALAEETLEEGLPEEVLDEEALDEVLPEAAAAEELPEADVVAEEVPAAELVEGEMELPLLRDGHLNSERQMYAALDESAYSWSAVFRQRVLTSLESYQFIINVGDLQIPFYDREAVASVLLTVLEENCRFFYLQGNVRYAGYQGGNMEYLQVFASEGWQVAGTGEPDIVKIQADRKVYESVVQAALSKIAPAMNDVEKVLTLHDFLVRECEYDWGNYDKGVIPDASFNSFGALVNGVAVCQGYAEAMQDLCSRVGIPTVLASSMQMNHAWNMVYLNGHWYHLDATWDDGMGYDYFLFSDEEFLRREHYGWEVWCKDIKADNSGAFTNYCFYDQINQMNYVAGKWYYLSGLQNICGEKIDGTAPVSYQLPEPFYNMYGDGNIMYLGKSDGIYVTLAPDFKCVVPYILFSEIPETANCYLVDFVVRNGWLVTELGDGTADGYKTMLFNLKKAWDKYTVKFETNGGSTVDAITGVLAGYGIKEPKAPFKRGCYLEGWYLDKNFKTKWDFANDVVLKNITLYAKWEKWENPNDVRGIFTDIPNEEWIYKYVQYVYDRSIMNGVGASFGTYDKLTREQWVTTLYRLDGAGKVAYKDIFPDVAPGQYYADAVLWAVENGITKGYPTGEFGVGDAITREQLATILYRYAQYKGYDVSGKKDLSGFVDANKVHENWGAEPLQWAAANGIVNGKPGNKLDPIGTAMRAECAKMLGSFMMAFIEE